MLKLIKDAYVLYLRNLPLIVVFALPLLALSIIDIYIRRAAPESAYLGAVMFIVLALAGTATDISLYRRFFHYSIINPLSSLRAFALYLVCQLATSAVGTLPIFGLQYLFSLTGLPPYISFLAAVIVCIFTFFALMTRLEIILPLIVQNKIPALREFWNYTRRPWKQWIQAALLLFVPYIILYYIFSGMPVVNTVLTTVFAFVTLCFNTVYINNRRPAQTLPRTEDKTPLTPEPVPAHAKAGRPAPAPKSAAPKKTKAPAAKKPLKKPAPKKAPKKGAPKLKPAFAKI